MEQSIQPFDLHRMFLGDMPILFMLEVVFRTAFMYGYTLLAARFIGKRGLGQLTPFEFIVVIVLGSAAGDPMFYPDVPLLHGVAVLTTVVILERFLGYLTRKSTKARTFIESTPALVISNGEMNTKVLEEEQINEEEIRMQLRMQGVEDVARVKKAYLEPSGKLSIFQKKRDKSRRKKPTDPKMNI